MQTYIPQPPSLKGDERAQLEQMYRYLYKMSEQLNTALAVTDREYQIVVQTKSGSAPGSESPISPQLNAQYRELRSLIIKTADIVNQQMDKTIKQLNGKFEAISSEWGTFEQNIERKIVETAEATIDSFDYSEKIHGIEKTVLDGVTSYAIESLGYIKRGIIGFDDENFPIYGIAVGTELKEKTVEKDGKTYQQIDTTKRIATYTSDAITFWRNDVAIARFSGDELYVTRAEITQQIRLGDWFFSVAESGGLNISKRLGSAIDISENGTITSLVGNINEANTSISQTRNDITALAKRTSAAEDKISSTESKLELKADSATLNVVQETVDGLSGRVSTAESKLELKADSASLSVVETNLKDYVTDKVDNLSIGGRNYFVDSKGPMTASGTETALRPVWIGKTASVEACQELYDGETTVALSFDWENHVTDGYANMLFNTTWQVIKNFDASTPVTGHFSKTFVLNSASVSSVNTVYVQKPYTGDLIIRNIKLEKGNKSTDWSPAPEDSEGEINGLKDRMSSAELKITDSAIVSTVTSSESYNTLSGTANTNAANISALTTRMSSAEQKITDSAIVSTVTQSTEYKALNDRVSTAESKIEQKADSVTLSVLETKVDGISIGGRNLLKGTQNDVWQAYTAGLHYVRPYTELAALGVAAGDVLTYSMDIKADKSTRLRMIMTTSQSDNRVLDVYGGWLYPAEGRAWVSAAVPSTAKYVRMYIQSKDIVTVDGRWKGEKLEKGNKATDWSPAPEDPAGSLSVNSDYSKVDINTERVRIVSKRMEVAVPSDDGEDDVLRVDADGVHAEVVEADRIVSESVVHTQGAASYTPANAGELAEILTELSGKHLTGDVDINCLHVTSGNFEVQGLSGAAGNLTLRNGAMNALTVHGCDRSAVVYVESMAFSTSGVAVAVDNAAVMLTECSLSAGTGLRLGANWPSEAWMTDCEGDCTTLATLGSYSRLYVGGIKPAGTLNCAAGSEVYNSTDDPTFTAASSPSIPTTQTVTVSLSPTSTSTSGYGSKLYQGRYSSSQSLRKGVMLFSLPSDLTSADKIDSSTLTLKRIGGVGQGGGVNVQVRCYDVTGTLYASKTAYENQTVSIDVTSAVKAMKTNGYGGLMLYNPDTTTVGGKSYTASYSRFAGNGESGAPVLKISYRK